VVPRAERLDGPESAANDVVSTGRSRIVSTPTGVEAGTPGVDEFTMDYQIGFHTED
jgi:hypothetical protein